MANPLFFCLFPMHFFLLLNQSIFRIISAAVIFLGIQYQPPPEDYNFGHCLLALLSHVAIEGQRPELGEWMSGLNVKILKANQRGHCGMCTGNSHHVLSIHTRLSENGTVRSTGGQPYLASFKADWNGGRFQTCSWPDLPSCTLNGDLEPEVSNWEGLGGHEYWGSKASISGGSDGTMSGWINKQRSLCAGRKEGNWVHHRGEITWPEWEGGKECVCLGVRERESVRVGETEGFIAWIISDFSVQDTVTWL